jgi:hypothetical protein
VFEMAMDVAIRLAPAIRVNVPWPVDVRGDAEGGARLVAATSATPGRATAADTVTAPDNTAVTSADTSTPDVRLQRARGRCGNDIGVVPLRVGMPDLRERRRSVAKP